VGFWVKLERLNLPPVDGQFMSETTSTVQRQFDVYLRTFRTWNLLFVRECFLIKNFQKPHKHNCGRLWYIARFVSLLPCCVPYHLTLWPPMPRMT
jgi:hypothetical protein